MFYCMRVVPEELLERKCILLHVDTELPSNARRSHASLLWSRQKWLPNGELALERMCSEECDAETIMWGWVCERATSEGARSSSSQCEQRQTAVAVPEVHAWKQTEAILTSG